MFDLRAIDFANVIEFLESARNSDVEFGYPEAH